LAHYDNPKIKTKLLNIFEDTRRDINNFIKNLLKAW